MNPKINTLKEIIEKLDLKVISEGSDLNRAVSMVAVVIYSAG